MVLKINKNKEKVRKNSHLPKTNVELQEIYLKFNLFLNVIVVETSKN